MGIGLNDDILLSVFDYYRLDKENAWNDRLGWCKLTHVCQGWRYLIFESAVRLGLHILCTNGTPIVDTLDHIPPLPIFVNYQTNETIREQDELGIYHALRLRDRVRSIDLRLPSLILHIYLMLMEEPFPRLEHLSLSVTVDQIRITTLILPKTFRAPNLCHLVLFGVGLPKRLRFLTSAVSIVTLKLRIIRASGYFSPRLLVARLQSLHQLEELSVEISIPIPRPSAERGLLSKQGNPVMLPNLKILRFHGVSAYLECLVAQIRAPLLERLNIALFNQLAFTLPLLSHFVITKRIKLKSARVIFGPDAVTIIMDHRTERKGELLNDGSFVLRVTCKQLDWQIDCAAQVCGELRHPLSSVEDLALDFHEWMMPTDWRNGGIDVTTWHELLRPFIGAKRLHTHTDGTLSEELSRALQVDEIGSDPGFLPVLRDLASCFEGGRPYSSFDSFIQARRVAGLPVARSVCVKTTSMRGGYDPVSDLNNYLGSHAAGILNHEFSWTMMQEGPNHRAVHDAIANLRGVSLGRGKGISKGLARRAAAAVALQHLGTIYLEFPHG